MSIHYRHKHVIDQCQTNGHNQLSMSTQTQARNYQCQTNGHDLQLIPLEQGQDYSLAVIKGKSLYKLSIFLDVRSQLGFNSKITSYAL